MTWSTLKSEHEGFPLFLRKPNYRDIYKFRDRFPVLLKVYQTFEKVKDNGLPESDYNFTLIDFDEEMTNLLDNKKEGLIFLIETFGGKRGYYYFISETVDYVQKVKEIQTKYSIKLETSAKTNKDWKFLTKYPIKLY